MTFLGEEAAIKGTTNLTEKLGNPVAIKLKGNAWEGGASCKETTCVLRIPFFFVYAAFIGRSIQSSVRAWQQRRSEETL